MTASDRHAILALYTGVDVTTAFQAKPCLSYRASLLSQACIVAGRWVTNRRRKSRHTENNGDVARCDIPASWNKHAAAAAAAHASCVL